MDVVRIYILMIWNCMHINGDIMCYTQLLPWQSAMATCTNVGGVPVSAGRILIPSRIFNDASFWTADYTTTKLHVSSMPVDPAYCGYRNRTLNVFGAIEFGDCSHEKHYICCQTDQFGQHCLKTGTWQRAVSCTTSKYADSEVSNMFPDGDYWVAQAYTYEKNTFRGDITNLPMPAQCGSVPTNGILHFENNCSSLRYSMCDLPDLFVALSTVLEFSECDTANVPATTKSVSPTDRPTARPHVRTAISSTRTSISMTASMLPPRWTFLTKIQTSSRPSSRIQPYIPAEQYDLIPKRTTAPSPNSNVSNLNIGLGVGLGGFVVIVVVVGLSCYIRRNMIRRDADKRTASARTEMNASYGVSANRVNLTLDNPCQIIANNDTYFSNSSIRHGRSPAGYEETCIDRDGVHMPHQENHRKSNAKSDTKTSTRYKDHLKRGTNELIAECNAAMNTLYFTSNEQEGLDHEYCNTDVMDDQYDGVHFPEAPNSVTLNEYSHIGFGKQYDHDENDYNVASSTNEQATSYLSDYDRLK